MLASPEWKTIPWLKHPKMPKDMLIDILVEIPGLLEDLDRMRDCEDEDEREILEIDLRRRCSSYDRELQAWNKHSAPTERFGAIVSRSEDNLSAGDLSVVYIMASSWATALLLYGTMRDLAEDPDHVPERASLWPYVEKIAQCAKYFFHPSTGNFGKEMANFPLGLALQFLDSDSDDSGGGEAARNIIYNLANSEQSKAIQEFLTSLRRNADMPKQRQGSAQQVVGAWPFIAKPGHGGTPRGQA